MTADLDEYQRAVRDFNAAHRAREAAALKIRDIERTHIHKEGHFMADAIAPTTPDTADTSATSAAPSIADRLSGLVGDLRNLPADAAAIADVIRDLIGVVHDVAGAIGR